MNYIIFTFSGLALPIAYKLAQEGQEVTVAQVRNIKDYVMEEELKTAFESDLNKQRRLDLFQGMIKIEDAQTVVKRMESIKNPHDYFVFFDENNLYRWADKVRGLGFEGNSPTKEDFMLEVDRDLAKTFVREHYPKLRSPELKEFQTVKEGISFLEKTEELWVLKGKSDQAKTFVPTNEDPTLARNQIIEMLNNYPKDYEALGYILEIYIPSIIELTPEKMYYDGVPLCTTLDIENKNFGNANTSVQIGCAEDLVFPTLMEDRINTIAFPPIVDEMARQHKGLFIWDASILINRRDGKMYFGEFCANRPGYNSLFTELSQSSSVHTFFENMVHKKSPLTPGTVGTSVRILNMNRDQDTEQISANISVNFKPETEKNLWLWDVKKNKDGKLVTVGSDWSLAVVTGSGKTIQEALSATYKTIADLSFVGVYYRSKDDYVSLDYPTSILNRLNYGLERGLYHLPFDVKVGTL